jgi:hypothetical protein
LAATIVIGAPPALAAAVLGAALPALGDVFAEAEGAVVAAFPPPDPLPNDRSPQ